MKWGNSSPLTQLSGGGLPGQPQVSPRRLHGCGACARLARLHWDREVQRAWFCTTTRTRNEKKVNSTYKVHNIISHLPDHFRYWYCCHYRQALLIGFIFRRNNRTLRQRSGEYCETFHQLFLGSEKKSGLRTNPSSCFGGSSEAK